MSSSYRKVRPVTGKGCVWCDNGYLRFRENRLAQMFYRYLHELPEPAGMIECNVCEEPE